MINEIGKEIIRLRPIIEANFTHENWEEIGLITGGSDIISGHSRLLRSLSFGDEDYGSCVLSVLRRIADFRPESLKEIQDYIDMAYPGVESTYISSKPSEKKITFSPSVFSIPETEIQSNLVAVMMPFSPHFDPVYTAIKKACHDAGQKCLRADDIWDEHTIIQDIFNLIYKSRIVIVDFSTKNPNVMYETGIAHTLGKIVIPVAQSMGDIPSDMIHHRALTYLNNSEGLYKMSSELKSKLINMKA
jgi:hypothetical protein